MFLAPGYQEKQKARPDQPNKHREPSYPSPPTRQKTLYFLAASASALSRMRFSRTPTRRASDLALRRAL